MPLSTTTASVLSRTIQGGAQKLLPAAGATSAAVQVEAKDAAQVLTARGDAARAAVGAGADGTVGAARSAAGQRANAFQPGLVDAGAAIATGMKTFEGDFVVKTMEDLAKLKTYERVTGNVEIDYYLALPDGDRSIAFPNLRRVGGTIGMRSCAAERFSAPKLEQVGGMRVEGSSVTAFDLPKLRRVDGDLAFWGCSALTRLKDFSGVEAVGGLSVSSCPKLTSLAGFEALRDVPGDVTVANNALLSDINALSKLKTVGGTLTIGGRQAIESTTALRALTSIGGLKLGDSYGLKLLQLPALVRSTGNFELYGAYDLTTIKLPKLRQIDGDLGFQGGKLTSLEGFGALTDVGGTLQMCWVEGVKDFRGLEVLRHCGSFVVRQSEIASFAGLENLEKIDGKVLTHWRNPNLPRDVEMAFQERFDPAYVAEVRAKDAEKKADDARYTTRLNGVHYSWSPDRGHDHFTGGELWFGAKDDALWVTQGEHKTKAQIVDAPRAAKAADAKPVEVDVPRGGAVVIPMTRWWDHMTKDLFRVEPESVRLTDNQTQGGAHGNGTYLVFKDDRYDSEGQMPRKVTITVSDSDETGRSNVRKIVLNLAVLPTTA